jgi:hypothetical protein
MLEQISNIIVITLFFLTKIIEKFHLILWKFSQLSIKFEFDAPIFQEFVSYAEI